MAPNRSKSLYAIKECSTCGSWYTKECCSIGNLNDQIIVPVPDSSLHCAVCGTPVDGPYCHGCTLIRMKFEKDLFTYCVDNGVFQNFQDTSESSNDNTNVVNAPREPSVVDQDPGVLISVTIVHQKIRSFLSWNRATIEILDPIPMADDRPMAEQLQAPTGGFESAIVVPLINAQNFELKSSLINLVQNRIFRGGNDEEPHAHIRHFESITNNQRYPDVPNTTIKLLLFPFSLDGVAKTWLDKEPPNSILTWDDLVSKFINFFFPPSKTTNLRNEITNFRQIAQESFSEAWERFKELLRKCPHHGFSLMHQLDTFYNSLSYNDQDSLNSAAGGNFLYKSPTEGLQIIENKAKVRCSRNAVMRVSTNAPPSSNSSSNFEFQQMAAALEDKMTLTFRNEIVRLF
ncbi:reverse transcriptase domain-containing protein [Tanacetum coccineum]